MWGFGGGASSHKCKRSELARKRESPATVTSSPGPCSADSINRADQRCRYAKLNRKSPPDQSAIPSRGGVCDRLNPVLPPLFPGQKPPGAQRPLVYTRKLIHLQERQGLQPRAKFWALRPMRALFGLNDSPSNRRRCGCSIMAIARASACAGGFRNRKSKSSRGRPRIALSSPAFRSAPCLGPVQSAPRRSANGGALKWRRL